MIFQHLLTHSIIISRMAPQGGNKVAMTTVTAAIVELQPLAPEKTALFGGVYGKMYVIYADAALEIREGDKIKDIASGDIFTVAKGGATKFSQGSIEYQKVIITK